MQMSLHMLILKTHEQFYKKIHAEAAHFGLIEGQPPILEYLKDHDGCRQKDIIREFSFSSSDTASLFKSLNENGLIEYTSDNKDRAFLTSKGRDAVRIIDRILTDAEQTALKGIEKQEYQKFMQTLMKIYFNLRDSANE